MDCALADLKVVEYGEFIAAPFCGKLLADMGAEVVKIEAPGTGDPARDAGPFPNDVRHPERSGLFLCLNTNKKSVTLDVKTAAGARIFRELLRDADILVEDNPPGEMANLGLGYDSLHEMNPRLVVVSLTPFGQTGPYRDFKGTDLIISQMSGLAYGTPWKVHDLSQEPLRAGGNQADFVAGMTAAVGAMMAIFSRRISGLGQHVDIAAFEALASFMRYEISFYTYDFEGVFQQRLTSRESTLGSYGPIGILPCRDGYVSVGTREQYQWESFVDMIGCGELAKDPRFGGIESRRDNWVDVEPLVLEWTMSHTKEEIVHEAQMRRVPIFPCNSIGEVLNSAQVRDRGYFVDVDHPETGKLPYPGAPFKLSGTPWRVTQPAPKLGEHSEEILGGRLGYGQEDLRRLRENGLV